MFMPENAAGRRGASDAVLAKVPSSCRRGRKLIGEIKSACSVLYSRDFCVDRVAVSCIICDSFELCE